MEDDQKTQKRPRRNIGEPECSIYANDFQMQWSQWDFKMTFGRVLSAGDAGLEVKPLAEVYLSPQHALAVMVVLARQLKRYEEQIGTIPRAGAAAEIEDEGDEP